jgi:hypothetical protein
MEMKSMKRFCLLSVIALAFTLFFAQGSNAFLAGSSDATPIVIDIVYDGYCDGAHLSFDFATGLADGNQTGCCAGNMVGVVAMVPSQGVALCMSYGAGADFHPYGAYIVIRADRTWTLYANDGGGIYVLNTGTWTPGVAADEDAALASSLIP